MTGPDLRAALDELDLRPVEMAALCGTDRGTVYRWMRDRDAAGALPVPQYAETIIEQRRRILHLELLLSEVQDAA